MLFDEGVDGQHPDLVQRRFQAGMIPIPSHNGLQSVRLIRIKAPFKMTRRHTATTSLGATSLDTTAPAPITAPVQMATPARKVTPSPLCTTWE